MQPCVATCGSCCKPFVLCLSLVPEVTVCMQSLLQAVGVGAKNSLPAAAGINWVLKDGLGRLGRLSVSTRFGTSFDSDLKVSFSSLQLCSKLSVYSCLHDQSRVVLVQENWSLVLGV